MSRSTVGSRMGSGFMTHNPCAGYLSAESLLHQWFCSLYNDGNFADTEVLRELQCYCRAARHIATEGNILLGLDSRRVALVMFRHEIDFFIVDQSDVWVTATCGMLVT